MSAIRVIASQSAGFLSPCISGGFHSNTCVKSCFLSLNDTSDRLIELRPRIRSYPGRALPLFNVSVSSAVPRLSSAHRHPLEYWIERGRYRRVAFLHFRNNRVVSPSFPCRSRREIRQEGRPAQKLCVNSSFFIPGRLLLDRHIVSFRVGLCLGRPAL